MSIAWQHNPQCEFHCEGVVHWGNLITVGASWFMASFIGLFVFCVPIYKLIYKGERSGK